MNSVYLATIKIGFYFHNYTSIKYAIYLNYILVLIFFKEHFRSDCSINDYIFIYGVLVSLTQLIETVHKICKVWGSNLGRHQKKYSYLRAINLLWVLYISIILQFALLHPNVSLPTVACCLYHLKFTTRYIDSSSYYRMSMRENILFFETRIYLNP